MRRLRFLPSRSPRRRLFLATVLGVAVGLGALLAVPRLLPADRPGDVPVVLVHGYGGTPSSFDTLAPRLRSVGRRVVLVALPDQGVASIQASSAALGTAVRRTRSRRVDLWATPSAASSFATGCASAVVPRSRATW